MVSTTSPDDRRDQQTTDPADGSGTRELRGLVVDWGGVLTAPLDGAITGWASADGVDYEHFRSVMRRWVGVRPSVGSPGPDGTGDGFVVAEAAPDDGPAFASPVHRLERGELPPPEFEQILAGELAALGSAVPAEGLLRRMLGGLDELDARMIGMLRRARASGLKVALLSNSWGDHYPEAVWDGLFDAIVISGRVGMRKPEERIFRHTADLLGLATEQCVMVDDLPHNITGAVEAGMVGVRHDSYDQTLLELEALFDRPLG